ncbi:MAG: hypothetical protein SangKO_032430 [Sandaracinaceae bacterium]
MRRLTLLALFALTSACAAPTDVGVSQEKLSHPGPWDIPADTLAIGDTQDVDYTGAGPWVGSSGCGGSLLGGTAELRDWLGAAFPQITHIGGYSCRHINGDSTRMSVHATGRAMDIFIPLHSGDADNDLGDPVANWLIEHSEEIGIQLVIWDRWTWGPHRTPGEKERAYGGAHPHHDHLHVELSTEAAALGTPWFSGPRTLPGRDCETLPADGGVLEETSDCFAAYGPATYWRSEATGHGGSMLWTNAFESDEPSNWARWHVHVEEPGEYRVEIYAEAARSAHRAVRYTVRHASVDEPLELDLSGAGGWVELGVFHFSGDGAEHVSVYDHSRVPVGADPHIPADAVRLTRTDRVEAMGPRATPVEAVFYEAPRIEGGDPRLDDDPMLPPGRDEGLSGGCAVSRDGSDPGALFLLMLGLWLGRRLATRGLRAP